MSLIFDELEFLTLQDTGLKLKLKSSNIHYYKIEIWGKEFDCNTEEEVNQVFKENEIYNLGYGISIEPIYYLLVD